MVPGQRRCTAGPLCITWTFPPHAWVPVWAHAIGQFAALEAPNTRQPGGRSSGIARSGPAARFASFSSGVAAAGGFFLITVAVSLATCPSTHMRGVHAGVLVWQGVGARACDAKEDGRRKSHCKKKTRKCPEYFKLGGLPAKHHRQSLVWEAVP